MRKVELGVFMPVGTNGFLMSKRTPRYHPSFDLHKAIAEKAEAIGLDYIFSMGKWMGFGGESDFWRETIEPISYASGLAAATKRLNIYATINPLLFHPAVAAKIIATIDCASGGRFGINIVTGNTLEELDQMGVVPEGYSDYRYDYADEWISVMKLLWTQDRTTFDGRWFHLKNCVSDPKPMRKPWPQIVSAGLSDEGLNFGAKHSDYQFAGHKPEVVERVRKFGAQHGRDLKASANIMLLFGDNDDAADRELKLIREELDHEAVENLIASFERDNRESYGARTSYLRDPGMIGFGNGTPVVGSPETVAHKLADLIEESGIDAIQFTFVDFLRGLDILGSRTLPLLRQLLAKRGVSLTDPVARSSAA